VINEWATPAAVLLLLLVLHKLQQILAHVRAIDARTTADEDKPHIRLR
jgi:hypothetical protein